jgi:hypothetical protein
LKIAYFDCFSGISGDMCLGALVDAGAPVADIEKGLRGLPIKGWGLSETKVRRSHFPATKVDVLLKPGKRKSGSVVRRWRDIEGIISTSAFSEDVKQSGLEIFKILFKAEAKVHGETFQRVHLHELGAVDCLIDVFGTLIGLDLLGVRAVYSSPLELGGGSVRTDHGILPVPAPATLEIIKGIPVYSSGTSFELTTPTGAAILKYLAKGFGEMPLFTPEKTGAGAGSRDIKGRPNVLRIAIGDMRQEQSSENISVIETNIDDMNPQVYEYLADRLFKEGALDVFMTQVFMKKMRPGTKLSVLCDKDRRKELISIILKETTSIGVRYHETSRVTMDRQIRTVSTKYGKARIKLSGFEGQGDRITPEYDDCRKIAEESGVPLLEIMEEVKKSATKTRRNS